MGSMPETPPGCKAIMPNNQQVMKKNCLRRTRREIKLPVLEALFPFLSFSSRMASLIGAGD
jgi:hypothetical protein